MHIARVEKQGHKKKRYYNFYYTKFKSNIFSKFLASRTEETHITTFKEPDLTLGKISRKRWVLFCKLSHHFLDSFLLIKTI